MILFSVPAASLVAQDANITKAFSPLLTSPLLSSPSLSSLHFSPPSPLSPSPLSPSRLLSSLSSPLPLSLSSPLSLPLFPLLSLSLSLQALKLIIEAADQLPDESALLGDRPGS